jgi:hypothetical protein
MSDTSININAVIDEVARRHKIRLAPDDPILATVTINEHVHKVFSDHLERLVEGVSNQATDRLAAQIETAKGSASKLVNDAGAWSAENLKAASKSAAEDIKSAVASALSTVQADIAAARRAKTVAIWAAVVALVVGGAFLGGAIGFWLAGR